MKRICALFAGVSMGLLLGATRPPTRPPTPYPYDKETDLDPSICQSSRAAKRLIQTLFNIAHELHGSGIMLVLERGDFLDPVDDQTESGIILECEKFADDCSEIPTTVYFELGKLRFIRNWVTMGKADKLFKDAVLSTLATRRFDAAEKPNLYTYAKPRYPKKYYEVRLIDPYDSKTLAPAKFKQTKESLMPVHEAWHYWKYINEH